MIGWTGPFCGPTPMVRRDCLPEGGFDERIAIYSDWKLWIDCLADGGEYGVVPGVLGRYRMRRDSLSHRRSTDPEFERLLLEDGLLLFTATEARHPGYAGALRRARAALYGRHSWYVLRRGETREARVFARRAVRESPFGNRLAWLYLLLAHSPAWLLGFARLGGSRLYRSSGAVRRRVR